MANWVADLLLRNPDLAALPIEKRERYSIHFKRSGMIEALFTGAPCHFVDSDGLWKPSDTALKPASGGFYGAPGCNVLIHTDGRVTIIGSNYQQRTELPGAPTGLVDGDRIIREFTGGRQQLILTENGFRQRIILDSKPTSANAAKLIAAQTGTISSKFRLSQLRAVDATKWNVYRHATLTALRDWLIKAVYPVTIDPDFADSTSDAYIYGYDAVYDTAHSTMAEEGVNSETDYLYIGQGLPEDYVVCRAYLKFAGTSAITNKNIVVQNNLKLVCIEDASATDFDVQIIKQDWSGQEPLADNGEAAYDNCLSGTADNNSWRNTSGMSINTQYTSGNLSNIWVNRTGSTYYTFRSSRDYAGTTPTGDEIIKIAAQEHATVGYRPVLSLLYVGTGKFFMMF